MLKAPVQSFIDSHPVHHPLQHLSLRYDRIGLISGNLFSVSWTIQISADITTCKCESDIALVIIFVRGCWRWNISLQASSPVERNRQKYMHERHARGDALESFAAHSRGKLHSLHWFTACSQPNEIFEYRPLCDKRTMSRIFSFSSKSYRRDIGIKEKQKDNASLKVTLLIECMTETLLL